MKIGKARGDIFDPFLLTGVSFSIIISLSLHIIGLETISSTLIALLGIIITLQIDLIARYEKNLKESRRFAELWNRLESFPWLNPLLIEILEAMCAIVQNCKNPLFADSARYAIENCRNFLQELSRGYLITDYDDIEPIMSAVEKAHVCVRAVSVSNVDETFWASQVGKRFWNKNRQAVERGVRLERIFIYDTWTEQLNKVALDQVAIGAQVQIYMIATSQLSADMRIDMTIVDEDFMYEAVLNSDGVPFRNKFSINKSDINGRIKIFNRLKTIAEQFSLPNES